MGVCSVLLLLFSQSQAIHRTPRLTRTSSSTPIPGTVLHSTNPDAQRHPASLTKIMTLYLLFEQLEAGKLKLD